MAAVLALVAGAAAAEPAGPSTAEREAAGRELAIPGGVGGCVFRATPLDVQRHILEAMMTRRGVPPELPDAVAKAAPGCTGRPYSRSDAALIAASLGAFQRTGLAVYFASQLAIGQHALDDAWRSASAHEKAPFLAAAANMLDPKAPPMAPSPAQTEPFARKLKLDDPRQLSPLQLYYLATAFSEAGEASLAAQGGRPPPRPAAP